MTSLHPAAEGGQPQGLVHQGPSASLDIQGFPAIFTHEAPAWPALLPPPAAPQLS